MRLVHIIYCYRSTIKQIVISLIFAFILLNNVAAQEDPPRPITATTIQNISFGTFYQGATGGSVTILSSGIRNQGGSVVLLFGSFSPAIFEITGNPGTVISFLKPLSTLSDGSGHSMDLQIDDTNPSTPFVLTNNYPVPAQVTMGGILTVGSPAVNPPGVYNGTFAITFVKE